MLVSCLVLGCIKFDTAHVPTFFRLMHSTKLEAKQIKRVISMHRTNLKGVIFSSSALKDAKTASLGVLNHFVTLSKTCECYI